MAGTLFGLGLSQQHDADGKPLSGCLLYIYQANTTTPVTAFSSPGLVAGQELPWPLVADSAGRIPAFWLPDGAYRARLTDEDGVVQFDEQNVLSVGSGSAPITVPSTPAEAIFTTGCVMWLPAAGPKVGWVQLNGQTLGSGSSGAANASAANQALFEYLWANFTDVICPVVPGRGASAAADWAANKQITLLDMRGAAAFGLDDMGSSAAGRLSGVPFTVGSATVGGAFGGESTHILGSGELPAHSHTIQPHTHNFQYQQVQVGGGAGPFVSNNSATGTTKTTDNNTSALSTDNSTGGGAPHNNMPVFRLGTWHMRL